LKIEKRAASNIEIRGGPTPKITGKILYDSESADIGFIEVLKPGCFRDSVENEIIFALYNHNSEKPLGNTHSGTLELRDTPTALEFTILPDTSISWAADAVKSIKRGDTPGVSFGFIVTKDKFSDDMKRREIIAANLMEISPVLWAAYPRNTIQSRKKGYKMNTIEMLENKKSELEIDLRSATDAGEISLLTQEVKRIGEAIGAFSANSNPYRPDPGSGMHISENRANKFETPGHFFQAVHAISTPGMQNRAATGLSEGVPSDGGFLVGSDMLKDLMKPVWDNAQVASQCWRIPVSGNANSIKINGYDETSRATGSRYGGIRGYWTEEAGTYQASKPKFRRIELNLNKLTALCYVTEEELEDAGVLNSTLKRAFTDEFSFIFDDAVIKGSGAGQPLGVLNSGSTVEISKESGQAAGSFLYENCLKMWARLLPRSKKDAVWYIHPSVAPALYSMSLIIGTSGSAVFMPSSGASGSPYATLFGRPVIECESCSQLGTAGDVILGDFKNGYALAQKGGVKTDMSIHVAFTTGENVFRFRARLDGQPLLASAIDPFQGSDTLGHFVTIETRS
jgi:HK97 family phage major capsid protein/HK97 family phage prohead protease